MPRRGRPTRPTPTQPAHAPAATATPTRRSMGHDRADAAISSTQATHALAATIIPTQAGPRARRRSATTHPTQLTHAPDAADPRATWATTAPTQPTVGPGDPADVCGNHSVGSDDDGPRRPTDAPDPGHDRPDGAGPGPRSRRRADRRTPIRAPTAPTPPTRSPDLDHGSGPPRLLRLAPDPHAAPDHDRPRLAPPARLGRAP